jgi:hypothetical protein
LKKLKEADPKSDLHSVMTALARGAGTELKTTQPTAKSAQTTDELLVNPETKRDAFALTSSRPVPEQVASGNNVFYVYVLAKRTLPDAAEIEKGLAEFRKKERQKVQSRMFSYAMETLKASSDIYVGPDLLQKAHSSDVEL